MLRKSAVTLITAQLSKFLPSKTFFLLFLTFVLICLLSNAGWGDGYHPRVTSSGRTLIINGRVAVILRGPASIETASLAAKILRATDAREVFAEKITRRKWQIATGFRQRVLLVTRADCRFTRGSVSSIAFNWALNINRLLSTPAIIVNRNRQLIVVPTGGRRSFDVGGCALPSQISSTDLTPSVTQSKYNPSTRALTIVGVKPGFATVSIDADDSLGGTTEVQLSVVVEDSAGSIHSSAFAKVTGSPASAQVVLQSVRSSVYRCVSLHDGAFLEIIKQPNVASGLSPGQSVFVPVVVRAVGSDLLPVEQSLVVNVQNDEDAPAESAQTLFYSNNPETVKQPQGLFDALVPGNNRPVRLVFHHQNSSDSNLTFRVELINGGTATDTIRLVRGLAGAINDPVDAGAVAGTQFLREWKNNSGLELSIPALSRLEILVLNTKPGDVASGIVDIGQSGGDDKSLQLHVDAESASSGDQIGLDTLTMTSDPDTSALADLPLTPSYLAAIDADPKSDQIYAQPAISASGTYSVGGAWLHLVIGTDSPLARLIGSGTALAGNYGVIYDINVTLSNPTTVRRQVIVSFASSAGDVSGIFNIVGGPFETVSDLQPPNEQVLARATLTPGQTESLHIQTVPLSGSAYPAAIVAHAL